MSLGSPRLHLDSTDSTNDRAKDLASRGAPHGTLVTSSMQTAGRGRQGRSWIAAHGEGLLISLVLRETPELLPLIAALAVAETIGPEAMIKWPNDVLVDGRKVAGVLIERRQHEDWTVLGIGVNVAMREFPAELAGIAGSLGRSPADVEPFLEALLQKLGRRLAAPASDVLEPWRDRDALIGKRITWSGGVGTGAGIDESGRLVVNVPQGAPIAIDAGEVQLVRLTHSTNA